MTTNINALLQQARANDDAMQTAERAPDGSDYNDLFALVTRMAATAEEMKIVEVTALGFDGENDDTDDRVLWVAAQSLDDVRDMLESLHVPYLDIVLTDLTPSDAGVDALDNAGLVARLFAFALDDARAALAVADSFMSGFEGDEMQEGIDEMLTQIRAAK